VNINEKVFKSLLDKELEIVIENATVFIQTDNDAASLTQNLHLSDVQNIAFKAHKELIDGLAQTYIKNSDLKNSEKLLVLFDKPLNESDYLAIIKGSIKSIPDLCEHLHVNFLNSQYFYENKQIHKKVSKHYLKNTGAVYTPEDIVEDIVSNCITNSLSSNIGKQKYLDFATGTGRFYLSALKFLNEKHYVEIEDAIVNNLFAIDVDDVALNILRLKAISLTNRVTDNLVQALSKNIICKNALYFEDSFMNSGMDVFDLQKDQGTSEVFDSIFSNPPYLVLKINKKNNAPELDSYYKDLHQKLNAEIEFYKTSGMYKYSIQGMLNYYQLSIEAIIMMTKKNGHIGIICPSSLFGDASAEKLRKHLLNDNRMYFIKFYEEKEKIFNNVTQATSIFFFEKQGVTESINISLKSGSFNIKFEDIKANFPARLELPTIDKVAWSILTKLAKYPKLKDITSIRNRRGELDLSLYKQFITLEDTGFSLIRGKMIGDKVVLSGNEFVDIKGFIKKKSDDYLNNDFKTQRLIGQQISNTAKDKRINFVWSKKTDIVANSCNYISGEKKSLEIMHIILNSSLLNWRFKITSTNNHINNYELDDLPVLDFESIDMNEFFGSFIENDIKICKLYGLTDKETQYITNLNNQ